MNLHNMRVGWLERSLAGLNRFASKRGQNRMPAHLSVGIKGEFAALFYLQRKGYTVVARRWSSGDVPGDVDLIAWHGPMLCFIEVKTRTAHDLTPAEVARAAIPAAVSAKYTRRRCASTSSASTWSQDRKRNSSTLKLIRLE